MVVNRRVLNEAVDNTVPVPVQLFPRHRSDWSISLYRYGWSYGSILASHSVATCVTKQESNHNTGKMNESRSKVNDVFSAGLGSRGRAAAWLVAFAGAVRTKQHAQFSSVVVG